MVLRLSWGLTVHCFYLSTTVSYKEMGVIFFKKKGNLYINREKLGNCEKLQKHTVAGDI